MRRSFALAFASLAVLAACAEPAVEDDAAEGTVSAEPTGDTASGGGMPRADDDLRVTVDPGDGSEPETWTLQCDGTVEGTHPEPAEACSHLESLEDPFAPLPDDIVCTEQYGGPQTAHVRGRWDGEPVDLELSRTDGCRIAQWDGLGPLLPVPVGVEPVG